MASLLGVSSVCLSRAHCEDVNLCWHSPAENSVGFMHHNDVLRLSISDRLDTFGVVVIRLKDVAREVDTGDTLTGAGGAEGFCV